MATRLLTWAWWAYWLFMFVMTHLPRPPGGRLVEELGDKLVHAAAYFLLAFLGSWIRHLRHMPLDGAWFLRWWLIYLGYAAADELLQPLFGRYCQLSDWIADGVGAALALSIAAWIWRGEIRRDSRSPGNDIS